MTSTTKLSFRYPIIDLWIALSALLLSIHLSQNTIVNILILGISITLTHFIADIYFYHRFHYRDFIRVVGTGLLIAAGLFATDYGQEIAPFLLIHLLMAGLVYFIPKQFSATFARMKPNLHRLWTHRMLIVLWLRYEVFSRYSQQVLGILWIMLVPLSTSLILALVFSRFLRTPVSDVPYIAFFLTALVPWTILSQGIFGSTTAILLNMDLINVVPFPREVLVIKTLGKSLVDGFFMLICMLGINAFQGIMPRDAIFFLPILLLIQVAGTLGVMFFISALSVLVRDVPQLVGVVMQLMFYLTPIVYTAEFVPDDIRWLLWINPVSFLVEAYRAIFLYNKIPSPDSIYSAFLASLFLLLSGYLFFKKYDIAFTDYV